MGFRRIGETVLQGTAATLLGLLLLWGLSGTPLAHLGADLMGRILYWPEYPALSARMALHNASVWVIERKALIERDAALTLENRRLKAALQSLGQPLPAETDTLIPAHVVLRYPETWWREVRIDRGSREGVEPGSPALADGFLVGRVSRVGPHFAWVELVTSSSLMIAVAVEETRDLGVLTGDDKGHVWLLYIPSEKVLKKGMNLSTALVGETLPPGIAVGKIWGADAESGGFKPYRVAIGAHMTQLYSVQILRQKEGL